MEVNKMLMDDTKGMFLGDAPSSHDAKLAYHLYQLMMEEPDPQAALENYRRGLELIHSQESYDEFLNSGFEINMRDDKLGLEGTMALIEKKLGL